MFRQLRVPATRRQVAWGGVALVVAVILWAARHLPAAPPLEKKPPLKAFDDLYGRVEKTEHGFRIRPRAAEARPGTVELAKRGDFEEAEFRKLQATYYDQLARDLGLKSGAEPRTLDDLLALCGWAALPAADIERLEPSVLMDAERLARAVSRPEAFRKMLAQRALAADDILAARFFSAKTTDVSRPQTVEYSWRKLVRLRLPEKSPAWQSGVESVYVLGNIYARGLEEDPFHGSSKNIQVILARREGGRLSQPLYWLIFGPPAEGSARVDYSVTSWDANNSPDADAINSRYYTPFACVQCHGWDSSAARLNPLDVDYWIDKTLPNNDFAAVGRSRWSAVFDGGKDPAAPEFARAFEVVRKLNLEILRQNELVDREQKLAAPSFQTRTAGYWLQLHEKNTQHIPAPQRGLPSVNGKIRWREDVPAEAELVTLLDRYCYRCHSSLLYNVFDKEAVLARRETLKTFLELEIMPQDRHLEEGVKQRLRQLLDELRPTVE